MPITESTLNRLVLKSGSTTLTLDRDSGRARLQRKLLFWSLKPIEAAIADIRDVRVDAAVDRASGVEVCSTVLVLASGAAWFLRSGSKTDAESDANAVRQFLA